MGFRGFVILLAMIVGLSGCATATMGTPFPAKNVALLRIGVSTTSEARTLLGEPHQIQTNQFGETAYSWQYIRSDATSGLVSTNVQTNQQYAVLIFGTDGRLLRAQQLINVPAPVSAPVPRAANPVAQGNSAVPSNSQRTIEEQIDALQKDPNVSYEEYQLRYKEITNGK